MFVVVVFVVGCGNFDDNGGFVIIEFIFLVMGIYGDDLFVMFEWIYEYEDNMVL